MRIRPRLSTKPEMPVLAALKTGLLFSTALSTREEKMLARGGSPAEPRVVGYIHQEFRSLPDVFPHQVGKDDLVADKGPELPVSRFEQSWALSRRKLTNRLDELVHEEEGPLPGNVFTKGDKVHLVVPSLELAVGGNEIGPVSQGERPPPSLSPR